jgi:aspartyl-tRNA(Asn)/glutamyl-tRNA(Gln) amidotransferase subunit A
MVAGSLFETKHRIGEGSRLKNQPAAKAVADRTSRLSRRAILAAGLGLSATLKTGHAQTNTAQASGVRTNVDEIAELSLVDASNEVRNRRISPVELTQACLARIERLNPQLNAFITVTAEQALAQARELEAEIQRGKWRGPLHGIPIALKDLIDTAGTKTTAASALYKDRVPSEDAEVVRRLKQAGAILLGKLNMDEFAFSFTSETSYFGPIHNPWDLSRTPGGSSGGSAAAVAARLCYGALGSDTGGSIRQPAAFCGIAGLKPSYGLVSTRGAFPLAWSLDHLGPMCRTVADCATLLTAIAGYDPQDSASANVTVPNYAQQLPSPTANLRLGVARSFFFENIDPEIESALEEAVKELERLSAGVREVKLPPVENVPVLVAEAYAYHEPLLAKSANLYHPRTRRSLEGSSEITMPQYVRARREMEIIRRQAQQLFEEKTPSTGQETIDLVITPTTARPPIRLEKDREPDLILLRNAIPMNLYDLPTISIPCGFTREGLPIGLQISGPRLSEPRVFAMAQAYEQATEWNTRRPENL